MKKIKIAHLYYDLMNLYGENGNMRIFSKRLEEQNTDVEVHFLTIDDSIEFNKYDFYYIGSGTENNQQIVLNDLLKYKNEIKEAIDNDKFFLITGNALELFGKYIEDIDGNKKEALNAFEFYTKVTDFRIVGEQIYSSDLIKEAIIGFQNRSGAIFDINNNLFKVEVGTGSKPKDKHEGLKHKNFYGTYLIGPILVRNPYFTEYLIKELLNSKNIDYQTNNKGIEFQAYEEFLKNYTKN